MRINGVPSAGLNNTSNFVPFNNGSGFVDSGFEISPPPINYFGNAGFQTRVGITLLDTPNSSQRTFGLKFNASPFFGAFSFIGDFDNNYTSTFFSINQFPNSSLSQAILSDNFNNQRYINIVPNSTIYGIGNDVTSVSTMNMGFIIDGSNGIGACYFVNGFGLDFSQLFQEIRIGDMNNNKFIGVDAQHNHMIVGSELIANGAYNKSDAHISIRDQNNNVYYIQLSTQ